MKNNLFRTLRTLLLYLDPTPTTVGYHGNPGNERAFFGDVHDGFRVSFAGEDYFVSLNYSKNMEKFQIHVGHARGRKKSGNNPDITFTETHFGPYLLLIVSPSLKRCKGVLAVEPIPIGDFPARVLGTTNRFLIGFPDADLFPRLFKLCCAKNDSIN